MKTLSPKTKKPKEPIIYKEVQYDSEYEKLFVFWLEEAILHGYVERYKYHPDPIILQDSTARAYQVEGKKKGNLMLDRSESLFKKVIYTPDFIVIFTQKAYDHKLVMCIEDITRKITDYPFVAQYGHTATNSFIRCVIDVKPPVKPGGNNASYRDLTIKKPLIWGLKGYYIQSVVPVNNKKIEDCLFSHTWAPRVYLERPRADGKGYLMNYCLNKTAEEYEVQKMSMDT